jgi:hypothetical protein
LEKQICGCPLSWNKGNSSVPFDELFQSPDVMMMANGGYCQEKRKACKDHPNWIQVRIIKRIFIIQTTIFIDSIQFDRQ